MTWWDKLTHDRDRSLNEHPCLRQGRGHIGQPALHMNQHPRSRPMPTSTHLCESRLCGPAGKCLSAIAPSIRASACIPSPPPTLPMDAEAAVWSGSHGSTMSDCARWPSAICLLFLCLFLPTRVLVGPGHAPPTLPPAGGRHDNGQTDRLHPSHCPRTLRERLANGRQFEPLQNHLPPRTVKASKKQGNQTPIVDGGSARRICTFPVRRRCDDEGSMRRPFAIDGVCANSCFATSAITMAGGCVHTTATSPIKHGNVRRLKERHVHESNVYSTSGLHIFARQHSFGLAQGVVVARMHQVEAAQEEDPPAEECATTCGLSGVSSHRAVMPTLFSQREGKHM